MFHILFLSAFYPRSLKDYVEFESTVNASSFVIPVFTIRIKPIKEQRARFSVFLPT